MPQDLLLSNSFVTRDSQNNVMIEFSVLREQILI